MRTIMKIRNLLILLITLVLSWLLPALYHMLTAEASGRFFVYYSAVTQHFCVIENDAETEELIRKDITSEERYTLNEFDSILPLLYYRQLLADGKMPKHIAGKQISAQDAHLKNFFFKYKPPMKNSPFISLYPLFESASGRVDLKMPDDVFRLKKNFEFIRPETNTVNTTKTQTFQAAFQDAGFAFPAKLVAGNPSPRKPYDEGYFVIDANDNLYHFKMVEGAPFLKKVELPKASVPAFFAPYEPKDRSFYGFLIDQKGTVYVVNTEAYGLQKLDCGQVDLDKNFLVIMGNPLYWTVRILSPEQEKVFAFDAQSKEKVATHTFKQENKQKQGNTYLFPFELKWTNPLSKYILPQLSFGNYAVLGFNGILAILFFFLARRKQKPKEQIASVLWILLTGIFGGLAILLLKK